MRSSKSPASFPSNQAFVLPEIRDDAIDELDAKFGFLPNFELKERLFDAFSIYALEKHVSNRPLIEKKLGDLRTLSRSAKELGEALANFTFIERWWLAKEGNNLFSLHDLENELHWLRSIVREYEADERGRKRFKRQYVKSLIRELKAIYREGTGRTDRLTYNEYADSNQYGGRFFDFVSYCFNLIGEKKSNSALGKAIQRALKKSPTPS